MTAQRKQQLKYLFADFISAEVVWMSFLLFRWLVYDGRVFGNGALLIPAFDFYRPLILFPFVCSIIYYLSGFYLRPFQKKQTEVFLTTFFSSIIISLGSFFVIIIDDQVTSYHRYIGSLWVLFGLQFTITWIVRAIITFVTKAANKGLGSIRISMPKNGDEHELYKQIAAAYPSGKDIIVEPRVYDLLVGAASIRELGAGPEVRITDHKMSDAQLCIKRAFDIVASAVTMILLSPVFLLLTILVKTSSKGPIIYKQERIGLHGIPFQILKFRTMLDGAENGTPKLTIEDDPRITKVGHWMRKYRLDELPQLWNILRGDMSIVGPRPERSYFIKQIEEKAPYYCLIYKIRPGLTSWGPIRVGYTDTIEKMVERLNFDITYMENMSIRLDLKIILYTIGVIIDGKGQ